MSVGFAYGLAAMLAFSLSPLFYKKALEGVDLWTANGLRAAVTLPGLAAAAALLEGPVRLTWEALAYALLSLLTANVAGDLLFFEALREAPVSLVYPLSYTFSVFAIIFSFLFLREPAGLPVLVAAALIIPGVALVQEQGWDRGPGAKGVLCSLATAVMWGMSVVFSKLALASLGPLTLNALRMGALLLLSSPFLALRARRVKKGYALYMALGGILGVGLGPVFFFNAINMIGASRASVLSSGSPIVAALLGAIVFGEKLGARRVAGVLLLTLSAYLVAVG